MLKLAYLQQFNKFKVVLEIFKGQGTFHHWLKSSTLNEWTKAGEKLNSRKIHQTCGDKSCLKLSLFYPTDMKDCKCDSCNYGLNNFLIWLQVVDRWKCLKVISTNDVHKLSQVITVSGWHRSCLTNYIKFVTRWHTKLVNSKTNFGSRKKFSLNAFLLKQRKNVLWDKLECFLY